jgi:dipeptidyl-peptidase-3
MIPGEAMSSRRTHPFAAGVGAYTGRMRLRFILVPLCAASMLAQTPSSPIVERVGDTGFLQLQAESFNALEPRQQALAYWLTQASIAIDPIIYDQLSQYGIEKRLLEEIVGRPSGIPQATFDKIRHYALLFWANRGNHNENTSQKLLPAFAFEELQQAALKAQTNGAFKSAYADLPPLATPEALNRELAELRAPLFDPSVEPLITAKTPPAGQDIVQASANTFYRGVTLQDVKSLKEEYPLNSRVVKDANGIHEEVYRAGTPDGRVPPGLYATYLKHAIGFLEKARAVADLAQAPVIADLIRFYQTGDPKDWPRFGAGAQRDTVDWNGLSRFIVMRVAPRAARSFVTITTDRASAGDE